MSERCDRVGAVIVGDGGEDVTRLAGHGVRAFHQREIAGCGGA